MFFFCGSFIWFFKPELGNQNAFVLSSFCGGLLRGGLHLLLLFGNELRFL